MEENTTPAEYRPAPGFNPYHHADALLGISRALDALLHDDAVLASGITDEAHAMASGLLWAQAKFMRELHEWLVSIEDLTTVRLPKQAEDFERMHVRHLKGEVREAAAIYAIL